MVVWSNIKETEPILVPLQNIQGPPTQGGAFIRGGAFNRQNTVVICP